jgi:hypothetical protein
MQTFCGSGTGLAKSNKRACAGRVASGLLPLPPQALHDAIQLLSFLASSVRAVICALEHALKSHTFTDVLGMA